MRHSIRMELKYELMLMFATGLLAFVGGFRKAKSTCCCCSLDFERDVDNKLQAVKVVKRQRSLVQPTPPTTVEPVEPAPPRSWLAW